MCICVLGLIFSIFLSILSWNAIVYDTNDDDCLLFMNSLVLGIYCLSGKHISNGIFICLFWVSLIIMTLTTSGLISIAINKRFRPINFIVGQRKIMLAWLLIAGLQFIGWIFIWSYTV